MSDEPIFLKLRKEYTILLTNKKELFALLLCVIFILPYLILDHYNIRGFFGAISAVFAGSGLIGLLYYAFRLANPIFKHIVIPILIFILEGLISFFKKID